MFRQTAASIPRSFWKVGGKTQDSNGSQFLICFAASPKLDAWKQQMKNRKNYSTFVIAATYVAFVEFHFMAIFKSCLSLTILTTVRLRTERMLPLAKLFQQMS